MKWDLTVLADIWNLCMIFITFVVANKAYSHIMKSWILFQFAPVGNFSRELKLVSETSAPVLHWKDQQTVSNNKESNFRLHVMWCECNIVLRLETDGGKTEIISNWSSRKLQGNKWKLRVRTRTNLRKSDFWMVSRMARLFKLYLQNLESKTNANQIFFDTQLKIVLEINMY